MYTFHPRLLSHCFVHQTFVTAADFEFGRALSKRLPLTETPPANMCEQHYTKYAYDDCGHREVEKADFEYCAIAADEGFSACRKVKDAYSKVTRAGKCYNCIDNIY
ncbi:uncharacterized protein SPSK_10972 [Sporothrix schenckii 1099-18]|uniref:Uncharacterized protein n=1 Tax=Sporothrix schenckii 1099-18 TaxID=1397361 RepID=A0A0F2LWF7_SPOSC|nr:uncharacterized protein SPSK_10972 [Sporothrix schenckii 1099-18]KJR80231.1 hypothetical protein SPSK_10972 [Sporothrix schenckii 1099-18]